MTHDSVQRVTLYGILFCFATVSVQATRSKAKLYSISDEITNYLKSEHKPAGLAGFEPGDLAQDFRVKTLDGEFVYPLQKNANSSVIIHAFTNKSAFLECLWTSNASLSDLVQYLPETAEVLFLSLDDSAPLDALWMREQVYRAATFRGKEILSRLHFSPIPVYALGNWIPRVLYSWGCGGLNCGIAQVLFTSPEWKMPVVSKRLNARYDWLNGYWEPKSYSLVDAGNGCEPKTAAAGAVAWVSEGGCSFYTKIKTMADSKAVGVLVYALPGNPIQDMNCDAEECATPLSIPASMLHMEPAVVQALLMRKPVNVSFQVTPSPNFFIAINQQGELAEMGWFLYPTFRFLSWQAQWFDFFEDLVGRLKRPAVVVPVLDDALMQGKAGAQAVVQLPSALQEYDTLELDAALSCPGRRDETCAHWDHTVQLLVCCERFSPYCDLELGRWITAFHRGTGRWLTDVSPLLPLLSSDRCALTMKTVPWAMPWIASLNLRFSHSNRSGNSSEMLRPFKLTSLYNGGTFDKDYNRRFQEIKFIIPVSAKKVELYAVITGHGSDENECGEFCVTSHYFLVNNMYNNSLTFESAGSALGCALRVGEGAVPNEHGTWLYGRGGWCDGLQVDPWRVDITPQLDMGGSNTILYFGLYDGQDPNPVKDPGLSREVLWRFVQGKARQGKARQGKVLAWASTSPHWRMQPWASAWRPRRPRERREGQNHLISSLEPATPYHLATEGSSGDTVTTLQDKVQNIISW
uniref:Peptide-N-glycosidase F N-terminal domain-containing protein n=1 Tax=Electrophorus electricus TaxID=8005 RepID=A0A4W4EBS1_ELEEL